MNSRFWKGVGWGVLATIAMSVLMIAGVLSGLAPMPRPIPVAIVGSILGGAVAQPVIIVLAVLAHLAYGGFWGGVLARVRRPITVAHGLALGLVLWFVMQVVVLPLIGWGFFGMTQAPAIALATLVLHAVYGLTLGAIADREQAPSRARQREVTA